MNKKILSLILICLLAIMLVGCNTETGVEADKVDTEVAQEKVEEKVDKKQLDKILVSYKSNSEQEMQVDIKNTSDKIFSGTIYIDFLDKKGENITTGGNMIGEGIVDVEDLKPGNSIFCNVNIEAIAEENIYMNHSFADGFIFVEDEIKEGSLNEDLAIKLVEDLKDSFGNEYFTTEWYPSIKSVEVYSTDDGINYIIATVSENGDKIGNIIFGNYVFGDDSDFVKVIVKDQEDNTVFTKSK